MSIEEKIKNAKPCNFFDKLSEKEQKRIVAKTKRRLKKINKKSGHWVKPDLRDFSTPAFWFCSECHFELLYIDGFNYCPNCGTKMEGENNE